VSSVVMLAESDESGKHVVVEHPRDAGITTICNRFSTHPSLRAYKEFIQEWDPTYRKTASAGAGGSSSEEEDRIPPGIALQRSRAMKERCCLVHNATGRTVVLALTSATEVKNSSGWMQQALKRHPVGRLLEKTKAASGNDRGGQGEVDNSIVISAGDIIKLDLFSVPAPKSEAAAAVRLGTGQEEEDDEDDDKPPSADAERWQKGTFHYVAAGSSGTTAQEREKAIGEVNLQAGQVVSFVCVESPLQVVYRPVSDQRQLRHVEIRNDSFEHVSVKCTQDLSSFCLESALDPGSSLRFEGRNPESRKVFKKMNFFGDTYQVTIKKDNNTLSSEVASGQILKIEGLAM